jgi:hypothetical protein
MTEKQTTVSEKAFLESLDALETLAKGMVPVADDVDDLDDLNKGIADEDLQKGDPDDEGGTDDDDPDEGLDKGLQAPDSFAAEAVADSENIKKAIEVSDFLADLVDKVSGAIDGIRKETETRFAAIEKSLAANITASQELTKALSDSLRKSFQAVAEKADLQSEDLRKSLETLNSELSRTPAHTPKSKTTVLSKSFGDDSDKKEMSKTDILKSLTDLYEKGDPGVTSLDIIRFESGGSLSPAVEKLLGL